MLRSEGDAGLGHARVELLDDFAEDFVRAVAEGDAVSVTRTVVPPETVAAKRSVAVEYALMYEISKYASA